MKSTKFADWLLNLFISLSALMILGQGKPWWLYLIVLGSLLLTTLLIKFKAELRFLFTSLLFFSGWILLYVATKESLQSFIAALSFVALVNLFTSKEVWIWIWLVTFGALSRFSSWADGSQRTAMFLIVLFIVMWLRVRLEKKMLLAFALISSLCLVFLSDFSFSVLNRVLKLVPQKATQESSYTVRVQPLRQAEEKTFEEKKTESRSFEVALEKIFFPVVLTLFGALLLTISLKLFKLKGTILITLLGAVIFALVLSLTSLVLSLVKVRLDLSKIEETGSISALENSQTKVEIVESTPTTIVHTQRDAHKIVTVLNWTSLSLLLLGSVFMVYFIFYVYKHVKPLSVENAMIENQNAVNFVERETLHFDGSERFVLEAYSWLRNRFFAGFDHLTPYEILKLKEQFEPFKKLTDLYVLLRYGKRKLTQQEIESFYKNFVETCNWLEAQSANSTQR